MKNVKYEVEKRSKIEDSSQVELVKAYLSEHGEFQGTKKMRSFLFQDPTFLRIRLIEGEDSALVTMKKGKFTDPAMEEEEYRIPLTELDAFIEQKKVEGYESCSEVNIFRETYILNGLKVEISDIDYLGMIIEIEALTDDKEEIENLEKRIRETMQELNLPELDPTEYKEMMDVMQEETNRPVGEQDFSIKWDGRKVDGADSQNKIR
ncbi:CYTH domain-containing protein [Patescibacteria group bacterium]|nr:CYTH domain-containing protein [Patescibacteria group bacterium]